VRVGGRHSWARWVDDERWRLLDGAPWTSPREGAEIAARDVVALPPVEPSKIVCVGRNYRAHAAELGNDVPTEPLIFLKPPSALLAHGGSVDWPDESERVDYEGEVAVVVGRTLRRASEREAVEAILGLTCADDVTARDLQRRDVQFTRGKGFDTFCPCGPWIETAPPPLDALALETRVDGELRQSAATSAMIWSIPELLVFVSRVMTLEPGDLLLTGTPEGVAPLVPGQVVEVSVGGVGVLRHSVGPRARP
jgi:2-keto-4-pentenoate hydratase/2-oxohepta-3-ene-1,7-dioic acid hydratase in catechol pathway